MTWFTKIRKLFVEDKGAAAAVMALSLAFMGAFAAAAVDLGMVYVARSELQKAADSAALAAANTMIAAGLNDECMADPYFGLENAASYAESNTCAGDPLQLLAEDVKMGYWDSDTQSFDPGSLVDFGAGFAKLGLGGKVRLASLGQTWGARPRFKGGYQFSPEHGLRFKPVVWGGGPDPAELTAVQVTLRKDEVANSPVSTFFAPLVGLQAVSLSATSMAIRDYPANAPENGLRLPIAIKEDAMASDGEPRCNVMMVIEQKPNENGLWTSFNEIKSSDQWQQIINFIKQVNFTPALNLGEEIWVSKDPDLNNEVCQILAQYFQAEGQDLNGDGVADWWPMWVPVVKNPITGHQAEIVGFANVAVTAVDVENETVTLETRCNVMMPGTHSGGPNFGSRAQYSRLSR